MEVDSKDVFTFLMEKHINPEKSRIFSREKLEKSIEYLKSLHPLFFSNETKPLKISVVGSNGKGSTSHYLFRILSLSEKTGLYTSPHLLEATERIQISGREFTYTDALQIYNNLDHLISEFESLSYFEAMTLIAAYAFQHNGCRYQVYEAGLGGHFDATAFAFPEAAVLTSISLEHSKILGDDLDSILTEKLKIICDKTKYLFYIPSESINDTLLIETVRKISPFIKIFPFDDIKNIKYLNYLERNFQFARFITENLGISSNKTPSRTQMNIPGRMEKFTFERNKKKIQLIFDLAHNPEAFRVLLDSLSDLNYKKTSLFYGLLPDKDLISVKKIIAEFPFYKIFQITDEQFHPCESSCIDIKDLQNAVDELTNHSDIESIIISGSTRLYRDYLKIIESI